MTGNRSIEALHMYELVSTDLQCCSPMLPLREVNRATEFRIMSCRSSTVGNIVRI